MQIPQRKLLISLGLIALLVIVVLVGRKLEAPAETYTGEKYTANSGELTGQALVGQTFVAERDNLSGISVMFATYSGRDNTHPVLFGLRESLDAAEDIRTATVEPGRLGDNQFYRFEFEPIANSKDKTYFFYVTSPASVPGNAVTVDVDANDPYHRGSAYLTVGDGDLLAPDRLAAAGKPSVDVVFSVWHQVPLGELIWQSSVGGLRAFAAGWNERQSLYIVWGVSAVQAFLFVGMALAGALLMVGAQSDVGKHYRTRWMLGVLFVLAVAARLWYAAELPVTNDEGNYLYDARTLLQGNLAGGDGYVKAPLVVLWLAIWELIGGASILAGRLSSIVIGSLTMFPLYFIGRELWGRRAGLVAAVAWALLGVTTVFNIYVHTQPLAIFFGVSGIAVLLAALRGNVGELVNRSRQLIPAVTNWFIVAGVLFGLGVISRKSVLALGLVPLILLLSQRISWRRRLINLFNVGIGFGIVVVGLLIFAGVTYGTEGFWEAIGLNSAEDGITAVEPEQVEQVRAYSLRGMTPFFRESMPLIFLSVLGFGFVIEQLFVLFFAAAGRLWAHKPGFVVQYLVLRLAWVVPVLVFLWAWSFFAEYEGSGLMVFGMKELWPTMLVLVLAVALLPSIYRDRLRGAGATKMLYGRDSLSEEETVSNEMGRSVKSLLVPLLWVGGLVFFYMNWIKFHANYIGEFLPPLVLLAGAAVPLLWDRLADIHRIRQLKPVAGLLGGVLALALLWVLLWSSFASGFVTYFFEHTGTFNQRAAREAAAWARENIPMEESIFTGAALIPYLSDHHTALDIAHPRWYAYEFTRTDPDRLGTFLPSGEQMLLAYRDANWFLLEKQTGFSFLMEYTEIEAGLETDWERVHGIENGSNTLTFYKRKR